MPTPSFPWSLVFRGIGPTHWTDLPLAAWARAGADAPSPWLTATGETAARPSRWLNAAWATAEIARRLQQLEPASDGARFGYAGGWGEDRRELWRGSYLDAKPNATHWGIDVAAPAHTPLLLRLAPSTGVSLVEAWQDPDSSGGWGGRLVLELSSDPTHWLVLAHLEELNLLPTVRPDRPHGFEVELGRLAAPARNGGWFPHLHVQRVLKGTDLEQIDGYGDPAALLDGRAPCPIALGQLLSAP